MTKYNEKYVETLEKEVQTYRNAAEQYGITAPIMLELAKSQIKTCADNIRIMERLRDVYTKLFDLMPDNLTDRELATYIETLVSYDGCEGEPFRKAMVSGLRIMQSLMEMREEAEEWLSKYAI